MKFPPHMRVSFALAWTLLALCVAQLAHSQTSLAEEQVLDAQVLDAMDKAETNFRSAQATVAVDIYTRLALCVAQPAHSQTTLSEEQVLDSMDKDAANFRSAQATVTVDIYTSVVDSTETQKGKIYFRRQESETQMALDMTDPPKYVLLSGGKLQLYEPKPDQVTVYDVSQHQDEYETFLKLGFGGGGHAMQKSFEIRYLGTEKIAESDAAKLDLVPKNPKVLHLFPHILLWIDPARGVALQQQLFQDNPGDYRMTKYSDIQLNGKIPDSVFKLKTDGKTKFQPM